MHKASRAPRDTRQANIYRSPAAVVRRLQHRSDCNGDLLISIWANACSLVVFRAVHVRAVVKSSVSSSYGSPSSLIEKMPVKASKGSVLRTLVLEEQRALLCPELLQISEKARGKKQTKKRKLRS